MGRLNGINLHEQRLSRRYLNLGDDDRVYIRGALNWASHLSTALRAAGWHELRVHIQLGEVAIH